MQKLIFFGFILCSKLLLGQAQNYNYQLQLIDSTATIEGSMKVNFINNSGKNLDSILIHLPPRALAWKNSFLQKQLIQFQKVDLHFSKAKERGSITIHQLKIDSQTYEACTDCEFITITTPLVQNAQKEIEITFSIQMGDARFFGTGYDGEVYRIVDWLPRIATLDSTGWHPYPVSSQNDIYHNFDNFEIDLNLNKDFIVASNASISTPSEIHNMDSLAHGNLFDKWPPSDKQKNIHLSLAKATSLQLFISKNFYIHQVNSNVRLFFTQKEPFAAYALNTIDQEVNAYFDKKISKHYTHNYNIILLDKKVGEYQSNKLLTLDYPKTNFDLASSLAHARAQQFFRYELAPNGFKDVWLARGLPYFYKFDFVAHNYPEKRWLFIDNFFVLKIAGRILNLQAFEYAYQNQFLYLHLARQGLDQAMQTSADSLSKLNYEAIAQAKTYLGLSHLNGYISDRDFNRGIYKYYTDFKGKIATPKDLKQSLSYYFFRDLDWFFNDFVHQTTYADYTVKKEESCPTLSTVTLKNKGAIAIPYSITGIRKDGSTHTDWYEGHLGKKTVQFYKDDFEKIIVNQHASAPEYSLHNNTLKTRGFIPKVEPLQFQLWQSFENPKKSQIFFLPSGNFNNYDKLLMGVSFYNDGALIDRPFEFLFSPEYSTGTGKLTGSLGTVFNIIPNNGLFHSINLGFYNRYYHYDKDLSYFRFSPSITFNFKRKNYNSNVLQKLRLRGVYLSREVNTTADKLNINTSSYSILNLTYVLEDISILKPYTLEFDFQQGQKFSRFTTSADFRWMLRNKRWMVWRNFAGIFLKSVSSNTSSINPHFYSLGLSGTQDYLYDYFYLGRSDSTGIWSQQFYTTDGGFKSQTYTYAHQFMLSTNLSVPIWGPLGVFGDIGAADNFNTLYWDYGVRVAFFTDFLEFYFPLENHAQNFVKSQNYLSNVRFVFNADLGEIVKRLRRGYY